MSFVPSKCFEYPTKKKYITFYCKVMERGVLVEKFNHDEIYIENSELLARLNKCIRFSWIRISVKPCIDDDEDLVLFDGRNPLFNIRQVPVEIGKMIVAAEPDRF